MKKKRKKATAVVVDGVVHAIGGTYPVPEPRNIRDDPWSAYRAKRFKGFTDPSVRLMCELSRFYRWHSVPRTHAAVTCMTCLVALARTNR